MCRVELTPRALATDTSATGEFKRLAAVFRNTISDAEGAEFRPEGVGRQLPSCCDTRAC